MKTQCSTIKDRLEIISTAPDGTVTHIRPLPINSWGFAWVKFLKRIGLGKNYTNDIVVNTGLADIANMIKNRYDYMSLGTGGTAPGPDDVACLGPSQDRIMCSKSTTTTFYPNDTIVFDAVYNAITDRTLQEACIHVQALPGVGDCCLCRETYTPLPTVAGSSTLFRWSVIICR
jgi:hypothetical protein